MKGGSMPVYVMESNDGKRFLVPKEVQAEYHKRVYGAKKIKRLKTPKTKAGWIALFNTYCRRGS